jgi:hypothetical protein
LIPQAEGMKVPSVFYKLYNERPQEVKLKTINMNDMHLPKIEGGRVIEALEIPLKKLKTKKAQDNKDRKLNEETVDDFERIISKGQLNYDIKTGNVAPTAIWCNKLKCYLLQTGEHKTQAHLRLGKDKIIILVIEFFDHDGLSAKGWQKIWQGNENDPENDSHASNKRTDIEMINIVVRMISDGDINNNVKTIKKQLKRLNIRSEKWNLLVTKIQREVNDGSDGTTPKTYTTDEATKAIKEKYKKCFKLSSDNSSYINEDDTIYISKMYYKVKNSTLDMRTILALYNAWETAKNSNKSNVKIKLIGRVDHYDKKQIVKVKKGKEKSIYDLMNKFVKPEMISFLKKHLTVEWLDH